MAWRLGAAACIAAVITIAVFGTMRILIVEVSDVLVRRASQPAPIDFLARRRETAVTARTRVLPPRPKEAQAKPTRHTKVASHAATPQAAAPLRSLAKGSGGLDALAETAAEVSLVGGPSLNQSIVRDSAGAPLFRVEPRYPRTAAARLIEGYVVVAFDISVDGRVLSPKVVKGEPQGVFDKAALDAVRRWKYKPKVVDGVALPQRGEQVKFAFGLPQERRRSR